ncbi:MAG: hypothetical protein RL322_1417 [Pseudomonadota bacterium]|jgi:deoxyribodipyrimidine photo-lyase
MEATRALVWFKRDLRIRDHAPLVRAQQLGEALAFFAFEPEWLSSEEFDPMHAKFALGCLNELRAGLADRGLPLLILRGSVVDLLERLYQRTPFTHLLSHEETGPGWSWVRDRAVLDWCRTHRVSWEEFTQTGVVRRLKQRTGWAERWQARMDAPEATLTGLFRPARPLLDRAAAVIDEFDRTPQTRTTQAPGERAAWRCLEGFLQHRASDYRRGLSSPLSARQHCSRLSPHLAFGTISMRCVHQATEAHIASDPASRLAWNLRGFSGRLRWHCHFMQKLEDEPPIEFRPFARQYDGLREHDFNAERFEAWCAGRTGFPMIDACMRSLRQTGWLNFRMRAMLVSFASYHLWLHWRPTGLFLAKQFLDFEPGIHWSQMQMQSGTTGINTLRIYSPTKQALDHDPLGHFIRKWIPELERVPGTHLAQPWTMDASAQASSHCQIGVDYPRPIVDEKQALLDARARLHALRRSDAAREEADRIQDRHGSRKSGLPASGRTGRRRRSKGTEPAPVQIDLFDPLHAPD